MSQVSYINNWKCVSFLSDIRNKFYHTIRRLNPLTSNCRSNIILRCEILFTILNVRLKDLIRDSRNMIFRAYMENLKIKIGRAHFTSQTTIIAPQRTSWNYKRDSRCMNNFLRVYLICRKFRKRNFERAGASGGKKTRKWERSPIGMSAKKGEKETWFARTLASGTYALIIASSGARCKTRPSCSCHDAMASSADFFSISCFLIPFTDDSCPHFKRRKKIHNLLQLTSCKSAIITQLLTFLSYVKRHLDRAIPSKGITSSTYSMWEKHGNINHVIIMKIVGKHYISLHARYRTANFKSASISEEARAERRKIRFRNSTRRRPSNLVSRIEEREQRWRRRRHWNPCIAAESRVGIINNN